MVGWHVDGTTSIDVDADLSRRRESMSATLWNDTEKCLKGEYGPHPESMSAVRIRTPNPYTCSHVSVEK